MAVTPMTWILDTGIQLAAGIILGWFLARRSPRQAPAEPKPVCGCGHHYAMHDPKTGKCNVGWREPCRWNRHNVPTEWMDANCACLRYSGPEPLPGFYAPDIAPGG